MADSVVTMRQPDDYDDKARAILDQQLFPGRIYVDKLQMAIAAALRDAHRQGWNAAVIARTHGETIQFKMPEGTT
jgi:hypothetical protein